MSCSKARVSSAWRCVCSAIFSLNFRGLALPEPGEEAIARPGAGGGGDGGRGACGLAQPSVGPSAGSPSRRPTALLRRDPAEEPPRPQSQRAAGSARGLPLRAGPAQAPPRAARPRPVSPARPRPRAAGHAHRP